jgi:hypothetical protein
MITAWNGTEYRRRTRIQFKKTRAKLIAQDAALDQASPADRVSTEILSREMDGLPLALDQAGAYIEGNRLRSSRISRGLRNPPRGTPKVVRRNAIPLPGFGRYDLGAFF